MNDLKEARKSIITGLRNENNNLKDEIVKLHKEIELLTMEKKEFENKYLNMLVQNEHFVDILDQINNIIIKSV